MTHAGTPGWPRTARVAARRALRVGGFVGVTAALIPVYVARDAVARASARSRVRDLWLRRWSGALLRLFAVRVDYAPPGDDAAEPAGSAPRRGRLVVANHRSALDIGILLYRFGGHMVSRADLRGWRMVGAAAGSVVTVFVDRECTSSGASTLRAVRALLRAGETVIVFPEGTTFEGDDVRPFHPGVFIGALRAGADVVPVGIAYATGSGAAFVGESFTKHLSRMAGAEDARVTVCIGDPLVVADGARAVDLATAAHDAVETLVRTARVSVDERR